MHDVQISGAMKPTMQIMPGSPLCTDRVVKILHAMGVQAGLNVEILPEVVISISPRHLVWWKPAGRSRIWMNNQEIGKRSKIVPHPALLFMVVGKEFYVFALKENQRPTATTPLYYAPYFNIYDEGKICMGNVLLPEKITVTSIPALEKAFFESEFTHPNGREKKIAYQRGEYAFWKDMLDGKFDCFPNELLVTTSMTLRSKMAKLLETLNG
jgi:PRTRC genetic system protein B